MKQEGKHNILGVLVDAVDYDAVVARIASAVSEGRGLAVSAMAVHGVMTGYLDEEHKARLNSFDLLVPDGQPVRWALNLLHGAKLQQRVYGPELMLRVCGWAEINQVPIYLYGSKPEVLSRLQASLLERFPRLQIAGSEPSKFRRISDREKLQVATRIRRSGARITFVGLGCPRQEVWAYEYRNLLEMPILAVGGAFDVHAGTARQAPIWMQQHGLEWLFRLVNEPLRLWRRYLLLNPLYVALVVAQALSLRSFPTATRATPRELSYG